MNSFKDRVAVVTGGSSGIGRATAFRLAALGAYVLITGRRVERLDEAIKDHPSIEALVADISNLEDASRTIAKVLERWGRLDILINNAGAGALMEIVDYDTRRAHEIFATNVYGPSLLVNEALPYLKESRGSIINVSSTYGSKPGAGLAWYGASKAALEYLTRCWALELASAGVRVNGVAVGPTESEALTGMMGLSVEEAEAVKQQERQQIPLRRRGLPTEIARWIVSFADPESNWVTGQVLGIDGGLGLT